MLTHDVVVELLQRGRRHHADLVGQEPTKLVVGAQRLDRSPGTGEARA